MRLIWCMFWDCPGLLDIVTNSFSPILDSEPLTLGPGSSLFISVTLQRVWWLVRKSSQEVLLILLEQDLIFQHDIENKVCPILLALSAPDGEAEYKAEAVSVICKLASVLSKSTVERRLLPRFCELCGDGKSFKFGRVRVNLAVEPVAIWRLTRGMAAAHLKRINLNRRKKSFPGGILMDDATLRCHDVVPGGIISLRIWHYDGWTELVLAAVEGDSTPPLSDPITSPRVASKQTSPPVSHHPPARGICTSELTQTHVRDSVYLARLSCLGVAEDAFHRTTNSQHFDDKQWKKWISQRAFMALYVASHRGRSEAVQYLLEHGANCQGRSPVGRTPLHVAAAMSRLDCISLQLNYEASINDRDTKGETPMSLACRLNRS
ncbi:ankyrin repeat domain-containing protein 60 isoform X1 [Tursiops truncatus]|uniref:ankyrin repeat domain-containing protein 60 isoform X1 n=1 Tax=Tursiops truncatus TaxID=9739 RepID=UPI003CCF7AE9